MDIRRFAFLMLSAVCAGAFAGSASAATPIFFTLDIPPEVAEGAPFVPRDVNNRGFIVGHLVLDEHSGKLNAGYMMIDRFAAPVDPAPPERDQDIASVATGIDDKGVVVGNMGRNDPYPQSWIYADGVFKELPPPDGVSNWWVEKINTRGYIVGYWVESGTFVAHAVLLINGTFTNVDYPSNGPDPVSTVANDINERGEIVGYYLSPLDNRTHGFIRSVGGQYKTLTAPKAFYGTNPAGINNQRHVTGSYVDQSGRTHGFLWIGGQFTTIDIPGSVRTEVNGINDSDLIVGVYETDFPEHKQHSFIGNALSFLH